ncbi:MAG: glycosyltransferase family 4 protein [Acidobacteriota bacterium]|nr:glycosyltransferase family 4 protein [Acidobacteriota bacterium]
MTDSRGLGPGPGRELRVAALISGPDVPSSRFRVRQFVAPLRSFGVAVSVHASPIWKYAPPPKGIPGKLWTAGKLAGRIGGFWRAAGADVVWLERELLGGRSTLERFLPGAKTVLDLDDALWLTGKPGFSERIAGRSAGVIAGNGFLAEHYRPFARRLWVVPTSIDTQRWAPASGVQASAPSERFTVGWTGTGGNLAYLEAIEEPLAHFLSTHPNSRLLVVSDRRPELRSLPPETWTFESWSPDAEVDQLRRMDVGLMPLPDDDWARGKCSAKMLLSMAVARPVVVSPVGTNAEILREAPVGLAAASGNDWSGALDRLHRDAPFRAACGSAGRALAVERYSVAATAPKLAAIFREIARAAESSDRVQKAEGPVGGGESEDDHRLR